MFYLMGLLTLLREDMTSPVQCNTENTIVDVLRCNPSGYSNY